MFEELKNEVFEANISLVNSGLVLLTWGNVSAINRAEGVVIIKPSGVDYNKMKADDMVIVNLKGEVVSGDKKPSSDTATHIELYKAFPKIGAVVHTHSKFATVFCQANAEINCLGTTHADHFSGKIPVTRQLTENEVYENYELNTGKIIVERFKSLDPVSIPSVLVAGHAPFSWGKNAIDAVKNSITLERVAEMALFTLQLNPSAVLPDYILNKHYQRKHGPNAYYGQK
ncbi:MAG: L-ribulose-5-phosphate 4-epimerase AraD [Ignavibacteria bacterium]|nr:L-ribulose-5-phosphate 4-epimerase AraD [Ignavibacteria bacterium]